MRWTVLYSVTLFFMVPISRWLVTLLPVGKVRDDALLILFVKKCHISFWVEMYCVFTCTARMKDTVRGSVVCSQA